MSKENPTFLQRLGLSMYVYGLEHPFKSIREIGDAFGCIDMPNGDTYAIQLIDRAKQTFKLPSYHPGPAFCKAAVDRGRQLFQELEDRHGPYELIQPKSRPGNPVDCQLDPSVADLNRLIQERDKLVMDAADKLKAHEDAAAETAMAYGAYKMLSDVESGLFDKLDNARRAIAEHDTLIDEQLTKIREGLNT